MLLFWYLQLKLVIGLVAIVLATQVVSIDILFNIASFMVLTMFCLTIFF